MNTYTFGTNDGKHTIQVKGLVMAHALHWAARLLKVSQSALVFIRIE